MKNIVVVGGGVQGTSVAYQLAQKAAAASSPLKITILESKEPASAASGKGGGFMARSWGDGSPTQGLHHLAFDMYKDLAKELGCGSYRKLPVLSVAPEGGGGIRRNQKNPLVPSWLDGKSIGRISPMGYGDDTAQITPKEFVEKMLAAKPEELSVVLGTCTGVVVEDDDGDGDESRVTGVKFIPRGSNDDGKEEILEADAVVVSAGPWSCQAEDWFEGSGIQLPMEGVKSTSIVWKQPEGEEVEATALFCGEDYRFNTHCAFSILLLMLFLFLMLLRRGGSFRITGKCLHYGYFSFSPLISLVSHSVGLGTTLTNLLALAFCCFL